MSRQNDSHSTLKPAILSREATSKIRKVFAALVASALLGATLFTASTAISNPVGATISFTAPSGLSVAAGGTITVDASLYASESGHTISCADATGSGSLFTAASFTRTNCSYQITAGSSTGTLTFTVPYSSTSTDTASGQISITVGNIPALAASSCTDGTFVETLADPPLAGANNDMQEDCQALVALQNHWAAVAANSNLLVPNFLRTWGTGTTTQQRVRSWAGLTIADVNLVIEGNTETRARVTALQVGNTGSESGISGTIPTQLGSLTSLATLDLNGHDLTGSIPTQLGSLTDLTSIDLSSNRLSGSIPTQLGSLTALTSLDLADNQLTSSVPAQLGTITGLATLGICNNFLSGSLPSALRSGVTLTDYPTADGYSPIQCQNPSTIQFAAPTNLVVVAGQNIPVDASSYASQGSLIISCADATSVSSLITIVRTGCSYVVTALAASQGDAAFTVPYSSSSGASLNGQISVAVSNIAFTAPTSVTVQASSSITINAASYASDGSFNITCGTATSIDAKITVMNTGCSYTVTAGSTTGSAPFTVPYMSSGGDNEDGMITVTITSTSGIIFNAPDGLTVQVENSITVNAGNYASDGANTVSCEDATNVDNKITIVRNGCDYIVTAGSNPGIASFTVPYSSTGGDSENGVIHISITPAPITLPPGIYFDFPLPPTPEPSSPEESYLRWNFFSAREGGAIPTEISLRLAASSYPDIWTWDVPEQRWSRVTLSTTALPVGITVAFRTFKTPDSEALEAVHLGTTRRATVSRGWSILSIPENLEREEAAAFLFASRLLDCSSPSHAVIVANYNTQQENWHIWLPCHPEAEARYTEGGEAIYNTLTSITQTHPVYLFFATPTPIDISWNTDAYEAQSASSA